MVAGSSHVDNVPPAFSMPFFLVFGQPHEYERLLEIRDNYPKYVLRTDAFAGGNYEGILTMRVADFLLSDTY